MSLKKSLFRRALLLVALSESPTCASTRSVISLASARVLPFAWRGASAMFSAAVRCGNRL